jgi:RimJ/RimL family protein N-acetyltransferase
MGAPATIGSLCQAAERPSANRHARTTATMLTSAVEIQPIREELIASLREAVGAVAEERRYLLTVNAFSLDETRVFFKMLLDDGGAQFVAVADSRVVGWCDVVRNRYEGTRHAGTLGMGILRDYRRQGLGTELLRRTLEAAKRAGIERVELEVFSSNREAIELYERSDFVHEGCKRRARILDDVETDIVLMAKFL